MSEKIQKKKVIEPDEYIYRLECEIAELRAERQEMLTILVEILKNTDLADMGMAGVIKIVNLIERNTGMKIEEAWKCYIRN